MRKPIGKDAPLISIAAVLSNAKNMLLAVGLASGVINVLALTGSFFMLQVYDRVIPSRSLPTLVGLVIVVATLYAFYGILEFLRSRLLIRLGWVADRQISGPVFDATMQLQLKTRLQGDGLQTIRDLDQVRSFLSGAGPAAFFDLPWMPIYLGVAFLFHPWIGIYALVSALILAVLAVFADARARQPVAAVSRIAAQRTALAQSLRQNIEVASAMGFYQRLSVRWQFANEDYLAAQTRASDRSGGLGTVTKVLRMMTQSGMLALGAILVIEGQATGGIIIASSILLSRSLAPVEQAINHWKSFVAARQGWGRLQQLMSLNSTECRSVELPPPIGELTVRNVSVAAPGDNVPIVQDASFTLKAGDGLGIIGPSASGKSTLVRSIAGLWSPLRGDIRLDGATLDQWMPEELGKHIGYLPQSVSLFEGTIAENIARFEESTSSEAVLNAANAAGIHDMIVRMPDGYDTQIGDQGAFLSAGQRQRIGLARALYGNPFLILLDEPNSNLDADGETALSKAILGVRNRGGIVVIVAHRPNALASVDKVMAIAGGRIQAFGPRDDVLQQVLRPASGPAKPVRLVTQGEPP